MFERYIGIDYSGAATPETGLPWIRRLLTGHAGRVHAWPFDGWGVPAERHVLAEVYPSLWRSAYERDARTEDQHDAFVVAAGLRDADRQGRLSGMMHPPLTPHEQQLARAEGWILGVA